MMYSGSTKNTHWSRAPRCDCWVRITGGEKATRFQFRATGARSSDVGEHLARLKLLTRGSQLPWGSKTRRDSGGTRHPRDLGGSTAAPETTEAGSTLHSACLAELGGPSGLATPANHNDAQGTPGHVGRRQTLLSEEEPKPLAVELVKCPIWYTIQHGMPSSTENTYWCIHARLSRSDVTKLKI